ncbi:2-amino-4-hydroxy-6-hydroxymethyldihydropteridine diphosphokinase [Isoptericola halotolerans]|uniref:2-amino-4-hydroxy-6- hydroxymethyldihydropteridine diphosphokinase n=1 Tax=Isoptericola halotolerans TaxID=300560 RepID=UPI00388D60D3
MTFADAVPGPDGRPLDQIRLSGVTATGHHGVLAQERAEGQVFRADVVLHLDTQPAAGSDDLAATVSYADVAEDVHDVLAGPPADLVETVAERIAAAVLAYSAVHAVDVRVHKPQAPVAVPFDDIEIVVRRDREHLPLVPSHPEPRTASAREPEPVPTPPAAPATVADPAPAAAPGPDATMISAVPAQFAGASVPEPERAPETLHEPAPEPAPEPEQATPRDPLDTPPTEPVDAVLALGSNLGDPQGTLRAAVTDIDRIAGLQVMEVSPLARTAAVGPEQPDFLNAVLLVRTTLPPRDLLDACQEVELLHGRVRDERWGPRTLDVDVVQYDSLVASADDLELPHPRARERAFVLVPWAEVDPQAVLGGLGGGPVAQLAATAPDRSGIRWLALDWLTESATTGAVAAQPQAADEPEQYQEAPSSAQPAAGGVAPQPAGQQPATGGVPASSEAPSRDRDQLPPSIPVPRQESSQPGPVHGYEPAREASETSERAGDAGWAYEPEVLPERQEPPAFVPAAPVPAPAPAQPVHPEPWRGAVPDGRTEHGAQDPNGGSPGYGAQPVYAEPARTVPPTLPPTAQPPSSAEQATIPAPRPYQQPYPQSSPQPQLHAPIPPAPDTGPRQP